MLDIEKLKQGMQEETRRLRRERGWTRRRVHAELCRLYDGEGSVPSFQAFDFFLKNPQKSRVGLSFIALTFRYFNIKLEDHYEDQKEQQD